MIEAKKETLGQNITTVEDQTGDYAPFDAQGGLGKIHQLFGDQMDALIDELNGELVA